MDESTYDALVADVFKKILSAVDRADPDKLDADATGDMVTITAVASGEKVVVNTQRAVRQIWVAGKGMGVHFRYDPSTQRWVDDKGRGLELFRWIDECVQAASGESLGLG